MDHYEILNVNRNASFQEIEKAYLISKAAFSKNSLAHYSLLKEKEREQMLDRIETAFIILGDEEKRHAFDENTLDTKSRYKEKAHFRQSTERMIFEDSQRPRLQIHFFRRLFSSSKKS